MDNQLSIADEMIKDDEEVSTETEAEIETGGCCMLPARFQRHDCPSALGP